MDVHCYGLLLCYNCGLFSRDGVNVSTLIFLGMTFVCGMDAIVFSRSSFPVANRSLKGLLTFIGPQLLEVSYKFPGLRSRRYILTLHFRAVSLGQRICTSEIPEMVKLRIWYVPSAQVSA